MIKKNNREYPLLEVPSPLTHNHDSKFSFFIIKDILKSKADQGIVEASERAIPQLTAGMFPGLETWIEAVQPGSVIVLT